MTREGDTKKVISINREVDVDELATLNRRHSFSIEWLNDRSSKGGLVRKLLRSLRKRIASLLLGDYLEEEQRFFATLVRHLNSTAAPTSISSGKAVLSRIENVERQIGEVSSGIRGDFSRSEQDLNRRAIELTTRVEMLESVTKGLERIIVAENFAKKSRTTIEQSRDPSTEIPSKSKADYTYFLLENRFRGSEEEIRTRLAPYVEIFQKEGSHNGVAQALPILEIGAGRGELQTILREGGLPTYGVDLDLAMCERCKSIGLDVRHENGIEHLSNLPDRSLSGLIAVQVVEHLPIDVLRLLLQLCSKKVAVNGLVIFETINTSSILALSHNYFRDPTHIWPLHPDTMRFLVDVSGLDVVDVRYLSEYPSGATLQQVPVTDSSQAESSPMLNEAVEVINRNTKELNRLIFGAQDYCIIARAQ